MAWNNLQQILSETINRHSPLINKHVKGKPAPWLNANVKAVMNHRDKLHQKFLSRKPTLIGICTKQHETMQQLFYCKHKKRITSLPALRDSEKIYFYFCYF